MLRSILLALATALRIPVMILCAAWMIISVFMMAKGFKETPGDIILGLQGVGLMLASIAVFPSRQHILYRLWLKRQAVGHVEPPRPVSRSTQIARSTAVVSATIDGPAALYDGRVRLDYIVPPPQPDRVTSWIGGLPKLSAHAEWPRTPDSPFLFLAQIALADLPATIWGGLGPRTGSLAFFTDPDSNFQTVSILHVDGLLSERAYPAELMVAQYYPILRRGAGRKFLVGSPDDKALPLTKWPVRALDVAHDEDLPRPYFKYRDTANASALLRKSLSLSNPAFVPYSWPTLMSLISTLVIKLNGSVSDERRAGKADDLHLKSQAERSEAAKVLMRLRDGLKRRARAQEFTPAHWDEVVNELSSIQVRWIGKVKNQTTGEAEYALLPPEPVLQRLPLDEHYIAFEYLSRQVYAADPDRLPPVVRAALEPIWQHDAAFEVGAMGGQINLAAYVTAGRSDLVCLLELPHSELVGTVWHDLSSFGIFIDPESLVEGRFDRAVGEVTEI